MLRSSWEVILALTLQLFPHTFIPNFIIVVKIDLMGRFMEMSTKVTEQRQRQQDHSSAEIAASSNQSMNKYLLQQKHRIKPTEELKFKYSSVFLKLRTEGRFLVVFKE